MRLTDEAQLAQVLKALCNAPGVALIEQVQPCPLPSLDTIVEAVLPVYGARLEGCRFAVRCKCSGQHDFTSIDVERAVGAALLARTGASGVDLSTLEVTVEMEIS